MTNNLLSTNSNIPPEGILLIDKSKGPTSFSIIETLRRRLGVKKIGHAGTLDPVATGVLVVLVGRRYTKLSHQLICDDKEYLAVVKFGTTTDSYDSEGAIIAESSIIPTLQEVEKALKHFQGEVEQIPPMYSAKKKQGKKLYELARQGKTVNRDPVKISVETTLIRYDYPLLELKIACSKGTYIRSIAYDLGVLLGCGAYLYHLQRTRSGRFHLKDCIKERDLHLPSFNLCEKLLSHFDF